MFIITWFRITIIATNYIKTWDINHPLEKNQATWSKFSCEYLNHGGFINLEKEIESRSEGCN